MENLCRINWKTIENSKQLQDAIIDWLDRDNCKDCNQLTRFDVLKLISLHNLQDKSKIKYDPENGITSIEISIDAKTFYGIPSVWHLTFLFPEFGDHVIINYVERIYGEIKKEDFYNYTHDITIA